MANYDTVSASAPKAAKSSGSGKLESVRVKVLENGFTVSCHHEPKPQKKGSPYQFEEDPEYAFGDASELVKFIGEKLGVKWSKGS